MPTIVGLALAAIGRGEPLNCGFVIPLPFRHTRSLWRGSIFFPSYPRFVAGIHLYKPQIAKVVGNTEEERSFFSRNGHNMEVIGQPVF